MLKNLANGLPLPLLTRRILADRFLRVGTLLLLATTVTNVVNFLFQVTMGRILNSNEFGTLNALLSLFMITIIPFGTIMMVLARQTSIYKVDHHLAAVRSLYRLSYRRLYGVGVPIFVLFLLLTPVVKSFLQLDTAAPIVLLGIVSLLSMSYPVNVAFLQGLQRFGILAVTSGLLGPLRYGFCVLLVLLGFGINGILVGHILCYLTLFGISIWPIHALLRDAPVIERAFPNPFARAHPEFMANLGFAFMTQFDLIMVKHLFSAGLTGTYAVAAVLGRAVMYLPVSLVLALFPMVTENHALNQDTRPLLWKALSYTLLLSGTGALFCWFFPDHILGFLFGDKYLHASPLLAFYGMAMLPLALLLVVMNFSIAQGRSRVWYLLAVGVVVEIAIIYFLHTELRHILGAVFAGGITALLLSLYTVLRPFSVSFSSRRAHIAEKEKSSEAYQ